MGDRLQFVVDLEHAQNSKEFQDIITEAFRTNYERKGENTYYDLWEGPSPEPPKYSRGKGSSSHFIDISISDSLKYIRRKIHTREETKFRIPKDLPVREKEIVDDKSAFEDVLELS